MMFKRLSVVAVGGGVVVAFHLSDEVRQGTGDKQQDGKLDRFGTL